MKKTVIILFLLGILTCKTYSQSTSDSSILLVRYIEVTECEVLKNNGKKVDSHKFQCDNYFEDIDDFSEFFPQEKAFYYDGEIEIANDDLIIFWDYGYKEIISRLPFENPHLKIKSFKNDSTLTIILGKKQIELAVNSFASDTIKYEEEIINYYYTKKSITLENLGLIERKKIIDNKTWESQKYELGLDAPFVVEIMPEFEGGSENLMKYIAERIKYPPSNESSENFNTKLYIEFIINETGKVEKIKVIRSINPSFDKIVVEILKNMPKWTPGMQDGKPVSVKMILPINIDLN